MWLVARSELYRPCGLPDLCNGHNPARRRSRSLYRRKVGGYLSEVLVRDKAGQVLAKIEIMSRCSDGRVGLHMGVVRRYFEATRGPVIPSVIRGSGNGHDRRTREEQPPCRKAARTCRTRRSFARFLRSGLERDRLCGAHFFTSNNDSAQILPL